MEDERFKYFLDCVQKNRELEEERLALEIPPKSKEADKALIAREIALGSRPAELLNFRPPKDLQLVSFAQLLTVRYITAHISPICRSPADP